MGELYEIPIGYSCGGSLDSGSLNSVVDNIFFERGYGFRESDRYGSSGIQISSKIVHPQDYDGKILEVNFVHSKSPSVVQVEGNEIIGIGYLDGWLMFEEIDFLHMALVLSDEEFRDLEDYLIRLSAIDNHRIRFESHVLGLSESCKWNVKSDDQLEKLLVESFSLTTTKMHVRS